jgi:hypothetical protein
MVLLNQTKSRGHLDSIPGNVHHSHANERARTMNMVTEIDMTCNQVETVMERAYRFGEEDGLEGVDMRGSEYFTGAALDSYFDGYAVGTQARREIVFVDADEIAFLDYALDGLRGGARLPVMTFSVDELDAMAQEAIGYDVQRSPWMY